MTLTAAMLVAALTPAVLVATPDVAATGSTSSSAVSNPGWVLHEAPGHVQPRGGACDGTASTEPCRVSTSGSTLRICAVPFEHRGPLGQRYTLCLL